MALFRMLFHDRARGYFFGASAITTALLSAFFDVFVLTLFLFANASEMFLTRDELFLQIVTLQSAGQSILPIPSGR